MAYIQSTPNDRTIYLTKADVPVADLVYSDVTVQYKKNGASGFVSKTMSAPDWVNLGGGIYAIRFTANELDTLGDFTFKVSGGSLFDNFVFGEFTIEPAPSGGVPVQPPNTCVVNGVIKTAGGIGPMNLIKIIARPPDFAATFGSNLVAADAVWTFADSVGEFSLNLVQGAVLLISIPRCGIRDIQITVPASDTANLLDLLPTIPVDYGL